MRDSGFDYHLDIEQIRDYKKLSPEQKLQWLEEIFLFTEVALSPKARKVRAYFRDGIMSQENRNDISTPPFVPKP